MGIFKKTAVSETISAGTEFLQATNSIIDSTVTNQKQRGNLKNQFTELFTGLDRFINDHVTARLQSDNQHGSMLTKNIRPLTLLVLVLSFVFSDFLGLSEEKTMVLGDWGSTAILFYFGARTVEKMAPMITDFTKSLRRKQ